ncbi:MAG: Hsp20 family protein [Thermoplasmatales archaeon]|nr:Hsp20 family protein [Thermoplasmatales archaeon]
MPRRVNWRSHGRRRASLDRALENLKSEVLFEFPRYDLFESGPQGRWLVAPTDVVDKGDLYEVRADLPGVRKENIEVSLVGQTLQVEGKEMQEKEEKGKNYVTRERAYAGFSRSVLLPEDVVSDKISAKYEDGVPKAHPEPTRKIPVA